ncbi:putative ribonuclease H-like domain-containing protein [Tanacetum coccineum]
MNHGVGGGLVERVDRRFGGTLGMALCTNEADNTAYGVSAAHTQSNPTSGDNLRDAVICAFLASQPNSSLRLKWSATIVIKMTTCKRMQAPRTLGKQRRENSKELRASTRLCIEWPYTSSESSSIHILVKQEANALVENKKKLEKAEKERDELKLTLEKFQNSSKSMNNLLESQNNKSKSDKGYHAVPPPYTGNFIPSKPDLTFMDEIVENENMDVIIVVTPSNVEFIPNVHDKTVRPSTEKIKFVKSARETVEKTNVYNAWILQKILLLLFSAWHPTLRRVQARKRSFLTWLLLCTTGNKCYLTEYEDYDGGFVSFGDGTEIIWLQVLKRRQNLTKYIRIPVYRRTINLSRPKDSEDEVTSTTPLKGILLPTTRINNDRSNGNVIHWRLALSSNLTRRMSHTQTNLKEHWFGRATLTSREEQIIKIIITACLPVFSLKRNLRTSKERFRRGTIDKTLFIKKDKDDILLVQVYVDDIIFGSTKKSLCTEFEQMMHKRFQMSSMGELTFFLGLQVKQKDDGIFISQDKYVADILKKFDFATVKTASTPMETNKALLKDEEAADVDVHLYRSMIGSLMYLTASRPDIMFAVCACARFQVTPKTSHLHAVKRIFRYLKGHPKLGLWYPRDSPFDLEAFSDSDYAGASLDRKSTTGGCQFLRRRLISWQCKKQTIVANSTTEAEYVAAANCCGQVLWIQNQLLDYGYNFMNTKIFIDNESTICIVKNPVFHSKTKHIEIRHHFIRDSYEKRLI